MKYIKFKYIFYCFLGVSVIASCKKVKTPEPLGDAGQTVVKIVDGGDNPDVGHKLLGVDFLSTPQSVDAVEIIRDVPTNAELSKKMTVVVKDDTAALTAYNTLNGTNILHLPRAWYTPNFVPTSMGGTYTLTFNPGDFSKFITLNVPNASVMDPSSTYGLAFTLVSNDGGALNGAGKTYIFEVGAKNAYDGIYTVVSGTVTRYTSPGVPAGDALSGPLAGNPDIIMITSAATQVAIPPAGQTGGLFWAYGNNSMVAGIDGLKVTVDPSTNLVTMSSSGNATLTNWAGHVNNYVPSSKTFNLAFRWNPTSTTREYDMVLKYKGPR